MGLSKQVRKLAKKWANQNGWPKRLEWIKIHGIRGWTGQRINFNFPIVAIVGENGVGKSTILQAVASVYKSQSPGESWFASDFFPNTPWETITAATISYSVREGDQSTVGSVRKPTIRWRGNPDRKERPVIYLDLRRTQPVASRTGYAAIAKSKFKEIEFQSFDKSQLDRLRNITGRSYDLAKMSTTNADDTRQIPVVKYQGSEYSGFHQGAGETALVDLLKIPFPDYGVVLIDEIETSLHPRAQRRLIRDLADRCRTQSLQIILTTHSPYILDELPAEGRAYVMASEDGRQLITGVSPYFAMTKMDEEQHPECDLYVEDDRAGVLVREILAAHARDQVPRCLIIPYGAASVGQALGQMASGQRFPRPSLVFLDGDQEPSDGCLLLPGDDAPERVVFNLLAEKEWPTVADRVGRSHSEVVDACTRSITLADHHEWVKSAADQLILGGDILWQALTAAWASQVEYADIEDIVESVTEVLTDS